jgi:hypothetical protein
MKMYRMFAAAALTLALATLAPLAAHAQGGGAAAVAEQQAAMKKLDWMHGIWRGPATHRSPEGEHKVTQTERIGGFLDGTLTVIEGKGYNPDGTVGFHAMGVVFYDTATKSYWMNSHTGGRAGKFQLVPTDNGYYWDIPAGPATIRYTATFADGMWTEVGDRIVPGQAPQRFFSMTLRRLRDTDWPEAGGVAKD